MSSSLRLVQYSAYIFPERDHYNAPPPITLKETQQGAPPRSNYVSLKRPASTMSKSDSRESPASDKTEEVTAANKVSHVSNLTKSQTSLLPAQRVSSKYLAAQKKPPKHFSSKTQCRRVAVGQSRSSRRDG